MEKSIVLAKKEYKYNINFKLSYDFLKYRNKLTKGFDFSKADKKIVAEITKAREKAMNSDNPDDVSFIDELSDEAIAFMQENSKDKIDLFTMEEIIDIISKITKIQDENEIIEILDTEVEEKGYDSLIEKIITLVTEVFTNAKDNSQQEEINKNELVKVAGK